MLFRQRIPYFDRPVLHGFNAYPGDAQLGGLYPEPRALPHGGNAALARQQHTYQPYVVTCLRSAIDNPRSELEYASDWISRDPDLCFLDGRDTLQQSAPRGQASERPSRSSSILRRGWTTRPLSRWSSPRAGHAQWAQRSAVTRRRRPGQPHNRKNPVDHQSRRDVLRPSLSPPRNLPSEAKDRSWPACQIPDHWQRSRLFRVTPWQGRDEPAPDIRAHARAADRRSGILPIRRMSETDRTR